MKRQIKTKLGLEPRLPWALITMMNHYSDAILDLGSREVPILFPQLHHKIYN